MKNLLLTLGLLSITLIASGQEEKATLSVTIENILNDNGTVLVSLHNKETFMKSKGILDVQEKAVKGVLTVSFKQLTPGTYAIMVLHDENDNKWMDFQTNGMPNENYGISGNSMAMGPPTFTDAKFDVSGEDVELTIRF